MNNVQGNFSLLTTQNRASINRSQFGTGLHKVNLDSSLFSKQEPRTQSRYGYNNRFEGSMLMGNRYVQGNAEEASEKKFDWGNGLAVGAGSALTGAAAGAAICPPWGAVAGAVIGFVGGLLSGGRSGG